MVVHGPQSMAHAPNSHSPTHTLLNLHKKYPNPHATHVVSVDSVQRSVDPDTGVVRSERIIGVQQGAPKWITKVSTARRAM